MALKNTRDFYYCDCNGFAPAETGIVEENVKYDLEAETITCKDCGTVYNVKPHIGECFRCGHKFKKYAWWVPSGCDGCHRSFVD